VDSSSPCLSAITSAAFLGSAQSQVTLGLGRVTFLEKGVASRLAPTAQVDPLDQFGLAQNHIFVFGINTSNLQNS
jgi:hypothetical protein